MEDSIHHSPPSVDVDDEYRRAIRTKSYNEIYDKLHQNQRHRLRRGRVTTQSAPTTPPSSPSSSPSPPITKSENFASHSVSSSSSSLVYSTVRAADYTHLSDYLDPPDQDILLQPIIANRTLHALLNEYFLTDVEACHLCSSVLVSIPNVRSQHNTLRRLLLSNNNVQLASYVRLENPFTNLKPPDFRHFHDRYASLISRLEVSRRKINARVKILKVIKYASGAVVVVLLCGISVTLLVVATHGIVAAFCPAVLFGAFVKRNLHCADHNAPTSQHLKQVDAAAKGAYILSRGLETLGRMVWRLDNEIEHGKDVARMLLRSGGERFLQKEVVREMDENEDWFSEALDELEEHVFWCLNTINKTRKLLARELLHHTMNDDDRLHTGGSR